MPILVQILIVSFKKFLCFSHPLLEGGEQVEEREMENKKGNGGIVLQQLHTNSYVYMACIG